MAAVSRLRATHAADEVHAALQLAEGRRRLAGKVEDPDAWLADSDGAQMATDRLVAQHKAARFAGHDTIDLCAGIGADARELSRVSAVRCVELDPVRAVMCEYNTGCAVSVSDAADAHADGACVHIDPARRDGSGRIALLGDLRPGPAVIAQAVRAGAGACVKLMPGVDPADLNVLGETDPGEVEYISLRGRLSQAAWWTGALAGAPGCTRATMVTEHGVESIAGVPRTPDDASPLGAWLYAVDPAPERAGLLAQLAGGLGSRVLHPALGVLTSDDLVASPWLTAFRVLERMPWRAERVRDAVASLGGGLVEVKTRGGAVDPDRAQLELRGDGDRTLTVFVLRFGSRIEAIVTERVR